jgi:hypothetical protein
VSAEALVHFLYAFYLLSFIASPPAYPTTHHIHSLTCGTPAVAHPSAPSFTVKLVPCSMALADGHSSPAASPLRLLYMALYSTQVRLRSRGKSAIPTSWIHLSQRVVPNAPTSVCAAVLNTKPMAMLTGALMTKLPSPIPVRLILIMASCFCFYLLFLREKAACRMSLSHQPHPPHCSDVRVTRNFRF